MPDPEGPASEEPEQLVLMRQLVDLSQERTDLSQERTRQSKLRSEMSAERSYMNAERTLSVWVRTALAAMVVGIAIDRFGLLTSERRPVGVPDTVSTFVGAALVAFGILMAAVTGARFRLYAVEYCRSHNIPERHGPFLAPTFALLVSLFGVALLVLLVLTR